MGNETARTDAKSQGRKDLKLKNGKDAMTRLESLDYKFSKFNFLLENARVNIDYNYAEISMKVSKCLKKTSKFEFFLKEKRNALIQQLESDKKKSLERSVSGKIELPKFISNKQGLSSILVEKFIYSENKARLEFSKRLKFLDYFSTFEYINLNRFIDDECYNSIVIPLSRTRFFYAMAIFEKKSYLKITDRYGEELFKKPINPSFYYRSYLAYGKYVIGIYDDIITNMNVIEVYNDRLELISSKLYSHKLDLLCINEFEVVCESREILNLYYFFNFNLEQVYSIRVSSGNTIHADEESRKKDISLLGSNQQEIYIFVRSKKLVKKLNRESGKVTYEIRVSTSSLDLKNMSQFKLDSECNFLFKLSNKPTHLKYYDFKVGSLIDASSAWLGKFNYFDLTSSNEIYSVDNLNKICYFI